MEEEPLPTLSEVLTQTDHHPGLRKEALRNLRTELEYSVAERKLEIAVIELDIKRINKHL